MKQPRELETTSSKKGGESRKKGRQRVPSRTGEETGGETYYFGVEEKPNI